MGSTTSTESQASVLPDLDAKAIFEKVVDVKKYEGLRDVDFGFENLVLEGGGSKGLAYVGMVKALEDLGILQKIKRFAGASMGSALASKLAIGADALDLLESSTINIQDIVQDATKMYFLPNLLWKNGFHTGDKMLEHFNNVFVHHTGRPDYTFKQLYDERGLELCVVVSNVDKAEAEYYHVKTTPDASIAETIRKSCSLPIMMQPIYDQVGNTIVDGGMMNNFPLNAYDGWYLSLAPQHGLLAMHDSKEAEFGTFNEKTLGGLVFDVTETEIDEDSFLGRGGYTLPERPDTELYRSKAEDLDKSVRLKFETNKILDASTQFRRYMREADLDENSSLDLAEFTDAIKKAPKDVFSTLFGENANVEKIFQEIDSDRSGEISSEEFKRYIGVRIHDEKKKCSGANEDKQNAGLITYVTSLINALSFALKKARMKSGDTERTIGIYTDYINTTDFDLGLEDKMFLVKQGWEATITFLHERKNKMAKEGKTLRL